MKTLLLVLSSLVTAAFSVPAFAEKTCGAWSSPRTVSLGSVGGVNKYGCGQFRNCVTATDEGGTIFSTETQAATGCESATKKELSGSKQPVLDPTIKGPNVPGPTVKSTAVPKSAEVPK